jgi:hypothetical protein
MIKSFDPLNYFIDSILPSARAEGLQYKYPFHAVYPENSSTVYSHLRIANNIVNKTNFLHALEKFIHGEYQSHNTYYIQISVQS